MFVSLLVSYLPPDQEVASIASPPAYVQLAATDPKIDYRLVDSCSLVDSPDASVLFPNKTKGGLPAVLYPADALQKVVLSKGLPELDLTTANVSILDEPQHGQLRALNILESARNRGLGYQYLPNPGYRGADFVKALVEYKGQRIKVIMKFVVVDAVIDNTEGAPGGYRNGNSGGGATVDKLANDCDANYKIRRIGGTAAEGQVFTQWADVVQDLARYTGRLAVSKVKSTPWLKQGSCGRCECSQ